MDHAPDASASELLAVVHTLLGAQELDDVLAATAHGLRLISRCDSLTLYEQVGHDRPFEVTFSRGDELASGAQALQERLCAHVARTGRTISTLDRLVDEEEQRLAERVSREGLVLARPMQVYGQLRGVLVQHFHGRTALLQAELDAVRRFVDFAAVAVVNARTRAELHGFAYSDPLTGLANRRRLETEFARLEGMEVSLLLVDFDGLKAVNDTLGYDRGDLLIRTVAIGIAATVSGDELACRLGGDEFVVVLPGIAHDAAVRRAEELTEILDTCRLPEDVEALFRGASVGYASAGADEDLWRVLSRATTEMRSRKRRRKSDQQPLDEDAVAGNEAGGGRRAEHLHRE